MQTASSRMMSGEHARAPAFWVIDKGSRRTSLGSCYERLERQRQSSDSGGTDENE